MCNSRSVRLVCAQKKWSMQENRYNNSEQMIQVKIRYIIFDFNCTFFKKLQWSFIVFERIGYWRTLLIYRFTGAVFYATLGLTRI